eukprot:7893786-Ditylum_brightwellii.AAC.1
MLGGALLMDNAPSICIWRFLGSKWEPWSFQSLPSIQDESRSVHTSSFSASWDMDGQDMDGDIVKLCEGCVCTLHRKNEAIVGWVRVLP